MQVYKGLLSDNDWIDFTNDIENLDKLDFSWRIKDDPVAGKGASNIDRGSSGEIQFTNKAYKFIMSWLNEHVSAPLNGIEVMIKTDDGAFRDWVIKNDGLKYCDDDVCSMELSLRQKDAIYDCIQTTLITDNHAGMFSGSYEHPRFAYCNEFRPAGLLGALFSIISILGFTTLMILTPILLVLEIIKDVILGILSIIPGTGKLRRKIRNRGFANLIQLI